MPAPKTSRPLPMALWLAIPILMANLAISLAAFVSSAAVPLDVLLADGGEAVIALGVFLGLSDLLLAVLFVVALLRVRTRARSSRAQPLGLRLPERRRPAGSYLVQPL